ncbi:MAG: multidrug ABC transporter ATP-binding protein [Rhodospirillaceae bacterium]|jgi:ABC-2 type transport system ATP-binding protein|nr:multidrug ABC transporter ATP-binding protein [Rhodospirillaceae bacterium]
MKNNQPSEAPDFAVEITGLSKTYAGNSMQPLKKALINVNLEIPRGSFFGLLGPNGAGKSTIINIMAGLVLKTSGDVKVWGYDIDSEMRQARSAIGVVPQELNIDPFFTPREILEVQAGLYGVPKAQRRTEEILAAVRLTDKADSYARTLSGGMRRRMLVAKAMVHSPPILVLDEPTAGVDVELRQQLWSYIRSLRDLGATILLTTHYLEEAEELCDQIAIINNGQVVTSQQTDDLLRTLDSKELIITVDKNLTAAPEGLNRFNVELKNSRKLVFRVPPSKVPVEEVLEAVRAEGLGIADLTTKESDLEGIFLMMTRENNGQQDEDGGGIM